MQKRVIQREDVFSNAKACYQTRKPGIKRENLLMLSNAISIRIIKHILTQNMFYNALKTCYPTRKHVIQREKRIIQQQKKCYPTRKRVIQRENLLFNAKTFPPTLKVKVNRCDAKQV